MAALAEAGVGEVVRPQLEGGIELMRHTLMDLGHKPRKIQGYADDLRESGYEALGDNARAKRVRAFQRLTAALAELDLRWVAVRETCGAAGRTLAELDLRAQTGANAVALRRDGEVYPFIDPLDTLRPGDLLGLMGTEEDLDAAARLLAGK